MRVSPNSSGGYHITLKPSEQPILQHRIGPLPTNMTVLRETIHYHDTATGRQYVVTTEYKRLENGRLTA